MNDHSGRDIFSTKPHIKNFQVRKPIIQTLTMYKTVKAVEEVDSVAAAAAA
jgi:hypothetical protein